MLKMGSNRNVENFLDKNDLRLKKKDIPIKKDLSELSSEEDWPENSCISCRWWVALSPEMNLGECRTSSPRRGKVKEKPEFAITPPNCFCRHHSMRNIDLLRRRETHGNSLKF